MKRALATLAVGSLAVLASACSGEDGQAEPQGSPAPSVPSSAPASSEATSDLPHSGAPAVDNPLPESAVSGDPCDTLTREQVTTALGEGAEPGKRTDKEELGTSCRWTHLSAQSSFIVGFLTETGEGLSSTYANAKPQSEVFNEVAPVEEYPAVTYKSRAEAPMCTAVVGIANEYAVSVTGTLGTDAEREGKDPCKPVQEVASWVVSNLKANG
ncbi:MULTISPECIES: DUF3558 domain-containing protein [Prauserella salsuginis group]|uniref:DUF3558 domain-containing protein n=1 Tax=Prauserella salsuginis TaxID=387889 RepID=A0ABW6GAY0_9PSEU|nr:MULTISPECIES: DUF3558 domain-containing protein [Prauserella salsuginis group]MCR3722407.1 Protein of unknown function (DUF3558) [Prauserella flava]MCR3736849.1 Protein of unknown function (DUF3558) [Prauserella salsuginis]